MTQSPTALIADDEPLLRDALQRQLEQSWPALRVVAQARNGREAIEMFDAYAPDVCFLDVQMPGKSGIEAAQHIGRRAHVVFVTAFDHYAVQAFSQGALDYLVKPVEPARLADTVQRLQDRLRAAQPATNTDLLLQQLATSLGARPTAEPMRWIRASVGQTVRLISTDDIDYLRSDEKYTKVTWHDEGRAAHEALIRMPLKEIATQLDVAHFVQIHRSIVVNLRVVSHVVRTSAETAEVHLKYSNEVLPVSRTYLHVFKQM
jgi:DNA-binding LytR/AlgR family response regulator